MTGKTKQQAEQALEAAQAAIRANADLGDAIPDSDHAAIRAWRERGERLRIKADAAWHFLRSFR